MRPSFVSLAAASALAAGSLAVTPAVSHAATGSTEIPGFTRTTLAMPSSDTGATHYFGSPLAISGNTIATVDQKVGDGGEVFVYTRSSAGKWSSPAVITVPLPSDLDDDAHVSIALSGNVLALGEMSWGPSAAANAGIVYLYAKPSGGWKSTSSPVATVMTPTGDVNGDEFGYAVALSGSTLVVGAPGIETPDLESANGGAAFVYTEPLGGWTGTISSDAAELRSSPDGAEDSFGTAVGVDGKTVAVAAPYHDYNTQREAGTGYVFVEPQGSWTGTDTTARKLVASDASSDAYLGLDGGGNEPETNLAVSGDTVVMGQYGAGPNSGAAYVYEEPTAGWLASTTILKESARLGPPAGSNASTGRGVAVSGSVVMVGAFAAGYGTAYLYGRPHSGWSGTVSAPLAVRSPAKDACLQAEALDSNTVLLGTPCDNELFAYTPAPPKPPVVSKLAVHPKKWRLGSRAARANFAHKPSGGTVITFTASEAATVTLTFKAHKTLTVHAKAGANKVWFDGVLNPHHHLTHGSYHVKAAASNANGHTADSHAVSTKAEKKKAHHKKR